MTSVVCYERTEVMRWRSEGANAISCIYGKQFSDLFRSTRHVVSGHSSQPISVRITIEQARLDLSYVLP